MQEDGRVGGAALLRHFGQHHRGQRLGGARQRHRHVVEQALANQLARLGRQQLVAHRLRAGREALGQSRPRRGTIVGPVVHPSLPVPGRDVEREQRMKVYQIASAA